jgi:hypothetical protein
MQQFWVVGGEYKDTNFRECVRGYEQWFGPFTTYEAARNEWAKHAWSTLDDAHRRYRIERMDPEEPPRCTD